MGKYKALGAFFDRVFRNDLNKNFEDIDTDIQTQRNRVNDLIVANPQPAEVQDARGGFTVLRDRLDNTDVQLAEKATKQYVDTSKRDVSVKLGQADMTEVFLQQMAGTTPINAIPADRSVGPVKLEYKGVTPERTSFISFGKNLFDKDNVTSGYYVNQLTGNLDANAVYSSSPFIPVEPSTSYTMTRGYHLAFYDMDRKFISGLAPAADVTIPRTVTTPVNAYYMRMSIANSYVSTFQVEKGSVSTDFEAFGYKFTKPIEGIKPIINLPPTIPAVVGKEINIYFKNIIENPDLYHIEVAGGLGKHQEERWTAVPTASGTTAIVISAFDKLTGLMVATASTNVVVKVASTGNGITRKALFIGDSTTFAGVYTQELLNMFSTDVMKIQLLGTRGTAPNLHEGRSGWTAELYLTTASLNGVTNPFYNPNTSTFDFAYYMSNNPTVPDVVAIHLGINDIFGDTTDTANSTTITNVLNRFETIINSIKAYNSTLKVALMVTIPPSASQDSFGDDYFNNQSLWRYRRNYMAFVKAFIAKFKGREASNIFLIPLNVNLDTVNNMQTETVPVNSRNSKTVVRQNNGVHPADNGYYQMADVIYYWLKGLEA